MSRASFADALRAEMAAVVARYEALVRAHDDAVSLIRQRETDELRAEIARLDERDAAIGCGKEAICHADG